MGKFGTCADRVTNTGRKAISVMMALIKLTPMFSSVEAKRMVSSCTLGSPFDMAQVLPVRHIVLIHCGTPAKYIVADKEVVQHADHHGDKRNTEKHPTS